MSTRKGRYAKMSIRELMQEGAIGRAHAWGKLSRQAKRYLEACVDGTPFSERARLFSKLTAKDVAAVRAMQEA